MAHINSNQEMQSLQEHSEHTFTAIKEYAAARGLTNCMKLTAFLHDCGKASREFQKYITKAAMENIFLPKVNHSSAGAQILLEVCRSYSDMSECLVKLMLANAIVSHHGLCDFINVHGDNALRSRCYPKKALDMEHITAFMNDFISTEELENLFRAAHKELSVYLANFMKQKTAQDAKDYYFYIGALQRLLMSLLIHGDREDTRNFMEHTQTIVYTEDTIWQAATDKLESHLAEITANSSFNPINELRASISDQCKAFSSHSPGIYRLSCPTGSGKTLASLRYALHHAKKYHKKHIIYVAPFKTILEQNAEVMKQFFNEDLVLEHHSNIIPSQYTDYDYYSSSWNKPVILTTAVRLFDVMFKDRTTDVRRFHQLADSVLIIDEAQKIPVQTISMFNEMMNFLAYNCNTTVVLCTATQPLLETTTYPIKLASESEIVKQTKEMQEQFKRVHIEDACRRGGYSIADLSDFIFQKLQAAGRCNRNGKNSELGTVYLINSNEEHIEKLKDVRKGQNETDILLSQLHASKEGNRVDELLTLPFIRQYYDSYLFDRRQDTEYSTKIENRKVSLFDLFSRIGSKKESDDLAHPCLGHALKSAGEKFEMIDSQSIGVLVPYKDGEKLINQLNSSISNAEKYALLDKTQRFMVNVYEHKYKELEKEDMIYQLEFNGMLVLRDGFYKKDTGLEVRKELEDMFV